MDSNAKKTFEHLSEIRSQYKILKIIIFLNRNVDPLQKSVHRNRLTQVRHLRIDQVALRIDQEIQ